jgi:sialic acid synthase SpsE/spore coat polysaccharide biosynthesis protein SpsF (cytidylyltransferase family)
MIHAVIQARMLSTRLRGKSLMAVNGKPLLVRVVERVRAMAFVGKITVATTSDIADDPIAALVRQLGIDLYRGDREDVLNRFVQAVAGDELTDTVLRFTADNPVYDVAITERALAEFKAGDFSYACISGLSHVVPEFIKVEALRAAGEDAIDAFDREHVTPFLRRHSDRFSNLVLAPDFEGLRPELDRFLTIDSYDQLTEFEAMLQGADHSNEPRSLDDLYHWLDFRRAGLEPIANIRIAEKQKTTSRDSKDSRGEFTIAGRSLGSSSPCFIVAEIGQNHNGQMGMAKRLIEMAAASGCDAVKFQKRDIACELTEEAFNRPYDNPNSFGATYGAHREFLELTEEQHVELREFATACGVIYFCTACDIPSVEIMQRVGNPVYKIASRDIGNIPLLKHIAETGKPAIISTGMAGMDEIREGIQALQGKPETLLVTHCVSQYPTEIKHVNLRAMQSIEREFGLQVGLSDHTTGIITCVAAAAMGAPFIEKHVTLSRAMPGTDHAAALEEEGLRRMVRYIRTVELAMGDGEKAFLPVVEAAKLKLARSLTSRIHIPLGTVLTEEHLVMKSPGSGLTWNEREKLIGRTAKRDIPADTTLSYSDFA